MHTVTKVLVVFAAVLCVLLAALTMAYSVNVDRITANYQSQVEARVAAETSTSAQKSQWAGLQAQMQLDIQKLNDDKTQLGTQIAALQNERTTLLKDKSDAVNGRDEIMNKIDQLAATNKTQALLIESYRNEVTKLREGELAFRKREIELVDRLNDLDSQREVLEQSVRALQEHLTEARRTIEAAGFQNSGAKVAQGPIKPSFPVSATIVQTSTDKATGKPMATINVGTNNQIRENYQLVVLSKTGEYLADFIVTQADLQWSRGEINSRGQLDANGKPVQVKEGDRVTSLVSSR